VNVLLALTPLLPLLAALPGGRWALPLLAPLTLYPSFREKVRAGDTVGAWRLGLLWAFLLSLGVILLVFWLPDVARAGILNGEAYRQDMFNWIATGVGRENDWRSFVPEHLLHLAVFLLLTWVSGGYLGLALGAALVGYMSYFVGTYGVASGHPFLGSLAAWVPWSVIRVLSFVLLGALFSRPLLVKKAWPFGRQDYQLMALAVSGLLADLLIKGFFAPTYGLFLRRMAASALASYTPWLQGLLS
jgi:hypothetical protein